MSDDIFRGTAYYYARFRGPYPQALLAEIVAAFRLDGSGRLLDVGCGTGLLTIPLSQHVGSVVALDVSAEMVEEAQRQSGAVGVTNVEWLAMAAEEVAEALGRFRLATFGASLHWMDRERVLRRVHGLLEQEGGVAVTGSSSVAGQPGGAWEEAVTALIRRYLGERRRAGAGYFPELAERHEAVIERAGFREIRGQTYERTVVLDLEGVVGHVFSTSYASRAVLGERAEAFEADLRRELARLELGGRFERREEFPLLLAWKR
jgi:ubiquinone/menaquinone biosynthesis C-methylase UbiE